MDKITPPLKLWLYVLMIVVFLVGFIYGYTLLVYPNPSMMPHAYLADLKQAIMKNDAVRPNEKSVVIFGSSLSLAALPYISEIEKSISDQNKKQNVLRVSIKQLDMETAEYTNFFNYVAEFPPDYLFLESNRLNIDDNVEKPGLNLDVLEQELRRDFKKLLKIKEDDFNSLPPARWLFYTGKFDMKSFKGILSKTRHVRSFAENKIANSSFAALVKHKTKIIFLDFPRNSKIDSVYLSTTEKNKMKLLMETYSQTYGIECWEYPEQIPMSEFIDGSHLNYKGAKKYTDWFTAKFNSLK